MSVSVLIYMYLPPQQHITITKEQILHVLLVDQSPQNLTRSVTPIWLAHLTLIWMGGQIHIYIMTCTTFTP